MQNNFQKEKRATVTIAVILIVYLVGKGPAFFYLLLMLNNAINWNIELFDLFCIALYFGIYPSWIPLSMPGKFHSFRKGT